MGAHEEGSSPVEHRRTVVFSRAIPKVPKLFDAPVYSTQSKAERTDYNFSTLIRTHKRGTGNESTMTQQWLCFRLIKPVGSNNSVVY